MTTDSFNVDEIRNKVISENILSKKIIDELQDDQLKMMEDCIVNEVPQWENKESQKIATYSNTYRYLLGWEWDKAKGLTSLKNSCEWHATIKPETISLSSTEKISKQGHIFHHGFTKDGSPIIYFQFKKMKINAFDDETAKLRLYNLVYWTETCIRQMKPGVTNSTWLIDLKDVSISISMAKNLKKMLEKLGENYAERLGRCIIVNPPWSISLIYNFARPFLSNRCLQKYIILKNAKEQTKRISEFVDEDDLLVEYGGKSTYKFDFEAEKKIDDERIQKLLSSSE